MPNRELEDNYPTGTDYKVYLTSDRPSLSGETLFPDFGDREPLDVETISIVEDGEITPLYDFRGKTTDHFAYSRRQVNGQLVFNYSERFARQMRRPLQSIQGDTLWVELNYIDRTPLRRVQDVFQISSVWEHPFRHEPDPTAQETVPFTARHLRLVGRRTADIDEDLAAELAREEETRKVKASDLFRSRQARHLATITEVVDGDTFEARLEATGEEITVRLAAADTPETRKGPGVKSNPRREENEKYVWPKGRWPEGYAGPKGVNPAPTIEQMDKWGELATLEVKDWIEGEKVQLVTDHGTAPKGSFDRWIFRVEALGGLPGRGPVGPGTDLATHLVKLGYAVPFETRSVSAERDAEPVELAEDLYTDHMAVLRKKRDEVRSKAGTNQAAGVWKYFDASRWASEQGLGITEADLVA